MNSRITLPRHQIDFFVNDQIRADLEALGAWIYLIQLADNPWANNYGEFHTSILRLSEELNWGRKKTANFIKLLERMKWIKRGKGFGRLTKFTITNFSQYKG